MAIYINLKEELKHENFIEKNFKVPFKSLNLPKEYSSDRDDIDIHIYVVKDKDDFIISMQMDGDINLECSRCLEPFKMDLKNSSNIILTEKKPKEINKELKEEDLMVEFISDLENFNLSNLVREEILLQTPMKPLCDEDCKGLCQVCGSNKNEVSCDCEEKRKRESSPFAKLKVLLEKKKITK